MSNTLSLDVFANHLPEPVVIPAAGMLLQGARGNVSLWARGEVPETFPSAP